MGLSRSFQITNILPNLSVFENLHCGVLWSLGYRYTFLKFLANLHDANARAEQLMQKNRVLVMGHGAVVFNVTREELKQNANIQQEWLQV